MIHSIKLLDGILIPSGPVQMHREMEGLTSAGRESHGLGKGHTFTILLVVLVVQLGEGAILSTLLPLI